MRVARAGADPKVRQKFQAQLGIAGNRLKSLIGAIVDGVHRNAVEWNAEQVGALEMIADIQPARDEFEPVADVGDDGQLLRELVDVEYRKRCLGIPHEERQRRAIHIIAREIFELQIAGERSDRCAWRDCPLQAKRGLVAAQIKGSALVHRDGLVGPAERDRAEGFGERRLVGSDPDIVGQREGRGSVPHDIEDR